MTWDYLRKHARRLKEINLTDLSRFSTVFSKRHDTIDCCILPPAGHSSTVTPLDLLKAGVIKWLGSNLTKLKIR